MLQRLIYFFINRKLLVNLLLIVIVLFGMFSLESLKRESMPEVDLNQVIYTTIYPGASPEDVELKVTIPLEDAVKEVDDIKTVVSSSYENISTIEITLEDYLSQDEADKRKQDLQKAIDRVTDLPKEIVARPDLFEVKMTEMPIIEVALSHKDPLELRKYAKYLTRKIEKLNYVSNVIEVGLLDKEVHILMDPNKLIATETPVDDVANALRGRNIRLNGGNVDSYNNERSIIADEQLEDMSALKDVVIRASYGGGKSLRLRDVCKVSERLEDPTIIVRSNGMAGISLAIVKKGNKDVLKAIKGIHELIQIEQQNVLPEELGISFVNDESVFTRNRIKIVVTNALLGIILVFISLKLFLDWKTAIWTAFGIPFSLIVSFIILKQLNFSINPISLGGFIIVIGMLVDDAIVVAENIKRHKEMGKDEIVAVKDGVMEVAFPVITTISTTIMAFLPMIFMTGIMGKFVKVMPVIVIVTLLASLVESLFFLPSHLSSNKKLKIHKKKEWVKRLEKRYMRLLSKLVRLRYWVVGIAFVFFIVSFMLAAKTMKFELLPSGDIEQFWIRMEAPVGTSLDKMTDLVMGVEKLVAEIPENEMMSYSSRVGHDSEYSYITNSTHSHLGIIYVYLVPEKERKRKCAEIMGEIKDKMGSLEKQFVKLTVEPKYFGPPLGKPVDVRLVSDDDKARKAAGLELYKFISEMDGVLDPRNDYTAGGKEYRLVFDYEKLAELGLNVFQVSTTIRTAYEGAVLFSIRQDNEDVDYRLVMDKKYRQNKNFLLNMPIRNALGQQIRLKRFAKIKEVDSTLEINRYNQQRAFRIYADLDQKILPAMKASNEIDSHYKKVLAKKYPSVDIIVSGEAEASSDSLKDLGKSFLLAILGIYFMLIILFNSFSQPLFVLSAVPFGLVGIIWAFYLHGQPFSFPCIMGFVGLSGVVVNDSLIMVDYVNRISSETQNRARFIGYVINGAATRLRPIILTSVTTVLGLMPTVYGWGGTDFVLVPLTMALGYGLLFATFITLILVPMLVVIHRDFVRRLK